LDAAWHSAEGSLVAGLREFGKAELSDKAMRDAIVYYPFSGPDALYPTACFPNNSTYVLVALEPSGTLPSLAKLSRKQDLADYLRATRDTMGSVLWPQLLYYPRNGPPVPRPGDRRSCCCRSWKCWSAATIPSSAFRIRVWTTKAS